MVGEGELSQSEARTLREELERLEKSVERHPALGVIQQMEELDRARWWYMGNSADCLRTIDALNHHGLGPRLLLEDEVAWEDDIHREYVTELGRAWHNFVAGAKTFADHMRLQFDNQPEDLRAEYEQKKRELLDPRDVVAFVARSRNVMLHGGVFQTGVTWKFTQTSNSFEADCRTDILLNQYKSWWNAGARRYIESKDPRLNLKAAVDEHAKAVSPLYEWYQERLYEYHYPMFADFEESAARIREINERLGPGSMPVVGQTVQFVDPSQPRPVGPPAKPRAKVEMADDAKNHGTGDTPDDTHSETESAEARPRWALFALGPADDLAVKHQLTQVRDLTSQECEDADIATQILSALTAGSPYEDLDQTYRELIALLDSDPPTATAAAFRYGSEVRRRFRHWLNDFRSFDDRTSAWLSRTFDDNHPVLGTFKRALSAEYDANFAYRLATALRNLSTHTANMLNHQMWHVSTGADGHPVSHPVLAIDGRRLVEEFPTMKATVRDELRDLHGLFDVRAVVDACMKSCLRAHCTLTHALWEEIEPERELVAEFHQSAVAAGGEAAIFVNSNTFNPTVGRIDHQYNPAQLLEQADRMRRWADELAPLPIVDVEAIDLLLEDPAD